MSGPLDVVSATGRGWRVIRDDDVRSDDGLHRLLRRGDRWRAYLRRSDVSEVDEPRAWEGLDFDHVGSLVGALDGFDHSLAPADS